MARTRDREPATDVAAALGAEPGISTQRITIDVPDRDRDGKEIGDQRRYVLEAIELLAEINGGATALPPVEVAWRGDGRMIWEKPVPIYSFLEAKQFFANLPRIRAFLHRMGRETNQAEVAFEYGTDFYRIRAFDEK